MSNVVIEIYADLAQKDGRVVRYFPYWYKREQCFKALPRSGDESNKDVNAHKVPTLEKLADLIEKGFAVRMAPKGVTSPVRVAPDNITVRR